jgi:hypothetical protein
MDTNKIPAVTWHDKLKPEQIDAAIEYLSLTFKKDELEKIRKKIVNHSDKLVQYKAKDILRASGLTPLPPTDSEVAGHLMKIHEGVPLHPVILVSVDEKLYIADGFHRVSACYSLGDDTEVTGAHAEL